MCESTTTNSMLSQIENSIGKSSIDSFRTVDMACWNASLFELLFPSYNTTSRLFDGYGSALSLSGITNNLPRSLLLI